MFVLNFVISGKVTYLHKVIKYVKRSKSSFHEFQRKTYAKWYRRNHIAQHPLKYKHSYLTTTSIPPNNNNNVITNCNLTKKAYKTIFYVLIDYFKCSSGVEKNTKHIWSTYFVKESESANRWRCKRAPICLHHQGHRFHSLHGIVCSTCLQCVLAMKTL